MPVLARTIVVIVAFLSSLAGVLTYLGVKPASHAPVHSPKPATAPSKRPGRPERLASSSSRSVPGNGDSGRPSFDSSGRYVVFTSDATNFSAGVPAGIYNIYRKDRVSGHVYLASRGPGGVPADRSSQFPVICSSGRYIAFASQATNLVRHYHGNPENYEVYVNDALTGQTTLVSISNSGRMADGDSRDPHFSGNCRKIVFESTAENLAPGVPPGESQVYVRNLTTHRTTLVSAGNGRRIPDNNSSHADLDQTGSLVAFTSWASNLPDSVPGHPSVYLRDLKSGRTVNISAKYQGSCPSAQGFSWPRFSPDGRRLVFTSVDRPGNPDFRGKCVLVWNTVRNVSAITGATGRPVGWHDACVSGVDNGTTFAPVMSDKTQSHPYYVLFTVAQRNGFCNMVLRDLNGDDIPVDTQVNNSQLQILEPSISSAGTYLAWDVASRLGNPPAPQQVYVCVVAQCTNRTA